MHHYFISLFLIFICSTSFANNNSFTITKEMASYHPIKENHSLSCISYHQTTDYTCGPAAAMSLMQYYGKLNASDLNQTTELRVAREMGATEGGGTSVSQLSSWLKSQGFTIESGTFVTSDQIIQSLKKGVPLFVGMDNHWLLAKGYGEEGILFADSSCQTKIIPRDIIDSAWAYSHMESGRRIRSDNAYIIALVKTLPT